MADMSHDLQPSRPLTTPPKEGLRLVNFVARAFKVGYYFKRRNFKNYSVLLYDFPRVKAAAPHFILAAGLVQIKLGRALPYQGELALVPYETQYDFTFYLDSRLAFAQGVKAPLPARARPLAPWTNS
ncbi:hypothetical protein DFAR_780001 [Desulfarculales bacterium]